MTNTGSPTAKRFEVLRHDEGVESGRKLGTIAIDASGMISVLGIDDDPDGMLSTVAEEQNRRSNMNVRIPPPPDAPPFAKATRVVERGTPEFVPALAHYLKEYFRIELRGAPE